MSIAYEHMAQQLAFGRPDRLNKALSVAGISANEMADYLGVSRTTISNYVNGHTRARKQTLRLWAMRTGVPLEWLEHGTLPDTGGGMSKNQELRFSGLIAHMHRNTHQAA